VFLEADALEEQIRGCADDEPEARDALLPSGGLFLLGTFFCINSWKSKAS